MEKTWDKVLSGILMDPDLKWFLNAKLNITENIFERNIEKFGNKTAIIGSLMIQMKSTSNNLQ